VMYPETMLLHSNVGGVVACDRCHRPAGAYWDDRPLPPVYRKRWTAPRPMVDQMADSDRSYIAPAPALGGAKLPEVTLSMATAAKKLNISSNSLHRLIDDRVINVIAAKNLRGGYRIPAREVLRQEVINAATQLRERRYAAA
jgi:AraC-like DNA-binding protein